MKQFYYINKTTGMPHVSPVKLSTANWDEITREVYTTMINTENEKEDDTMETKTTFTTFDGTTYTMNPATNRYSKTENGKTTRIGKAEYESAKHEYEAEQYIANLDLHENTEAEQAELDKDPCFVDPMADLQKPAVLNEFGCVDCSECNIKECVHRDCMRRNPRSEGGLAECPRLHVKVEDEAKDPELEQIKEEIPGIEDAEAELERNIRNEKKTKKAAKPRRSKDIAYEGHGVTLTAKQVDFIHHLPDTCFWEHGVDSEIWVDCLCDDIGGQFEQNPMAVGAMISTLCEKGLGIRSKNRVNGRKCTGFALTELGKKIAVELGL